MTAPILILSGVPGAGKSSVARAWLQTFPRGLHLPVDDLRELVVSGTAHPSLQPNPEVTRQFSLARQVAFGAAHLYAREGFAVALDDVLWPHDPDTFLGVAAQLPVTRVLLRPSLEAALRRNRERTHKPFDTATLAPIIEGLHAGMSPAAFKAAGWRVLDSSDLTLEETVARLRAWTDEAAGFK